MDQSPTLPLVDRLRASAAAWVDANEASLARLGRAVVNDGGFFTRLETQVQGTTTASLERFARFLVEPANWPADASGARVVPAEVIAFGHAVGVSAAVPGLATVDAGQKDSQEAA